MMPTNAPMNTWPGVLPTGVTGGKSIDEAPVSRAAGRLPTGGTGVTGLAAAHVVIVLPWVVTKNGAIDTSPDAPYRPAIVRDAATLENPMFCGNRSCEIGFQAIPPLPSSALTNTWPTLWVSTLCPVVSVSTSA